jgi:Ca2+-binding RTX toxin-like protein
MLQKIIRILLISLVLMIVISAIYGLSASNTVPESGLGSETQSVTAEQVKPVECNSLSLEFISSSSTGSILNDLVLGTSSSDSLSGLSGNDCLVGGEGDDTLDGGEGTDICIGGGGADTFLNCETEIQ